VIGGSVLSALAAAVILNLAGRRQQQREAATSARLSQ
jgi:NhaA family Na+:H+ antiporter